MIPGWTEREDALASAMWADGHSAAEISRRLHEDGFGKSRSAVIGRASRRGWVRHAAGLSKVVARRAAPKKVRVAAPKPACPPVGSGTPPGRFTETRPPVLPEPAPLPPDTHGGVHIMDIRDGQCRWVLGEPLHMTFCGAPVRHLSSYCHHHHGIAYQPTYGLLPRRPPGQGAIAAPMRYAEMVRG